MNEKQELSFNKRPSSLNTLWKAFKTRKLKFDENTGIPKIKTSWKNVKVNRKHVKTYAKLCGITYGEKLPVLYPLMLVYPFNLRIISLKEVPLMMFKMLNIHTSVIEYRPVGIDEILDLVCEIECGRFVEKGMELDIKSTITVNNEIIWECINTFYFMGRYGKPDQDNGQKKLRRLEGADSSYDWYLSAGRGFRFARVSGDSNGLHYSKLYSKMMGFRRDFAHPLLVAGKCLELIDQRNGHQSMHVDLYYKGQIYYESRLTLKNITKGSSSRFDLYCEGNDRPCMCGEVVRG